MRDQGPPGAELPMAGSRNGISAAGVTPYGDAQTGLASTRRQDRGLGRARRRTRRNHSPLTEPPEGWTVFKASSEAGGFPSWTAGFGGPFRKESRLRILIVYAQPVFWSMGEGRGAAIFSALPTALAARGHEVRVSLPVIGQAGDRSVPETYRGFLLHREPTRRGFLPDPSLPVTGRLGSRISCWLAYQSWGLRAARRVALAFPPDLIIGMGHYEAPVARRLARERGIPNVTRLFGNTISLSLRDPLRFYANFPEVIAFRTPADLMVLNDDGADGEAVARRFRLASDRFVHLRNGVDFDRFRPGPPSPEVLRTLGIHEGQPLLLTATRLAPEKKLERAIDVLRDLRLHRLDAVLALLGDGSEKEKLRRHARDAGIEGSVLFPGPIPQRDLPDWYRTATVVLSLLDRTNAANPVFEAMACGRPVAVLDAGTTIRVVRHGETGLVFSKQELPEVGSALAGLLDDEALQKRMGETARKVIQELVLHLPDRLDYEAGLYETAVQRSLATGRARGRESAHPLSDPTAAPRTGEPEPGPAEAAGTRAG